MTWASFFGIFALFFLTHSIPVRPGIKARVVARIGARGFGIGYSILSLCMLALLIWAANSAPYVELWSQAMWHRHVVHLGMFATCLIFAFSIRRPNPFSFGGARNHAFDPAHPGIVRLFRHPLLAGLMAWAFLHLLPNGDLAHVLLFGVLGGFAILGRGLINRRKRREMGSENWAQLHAAVARAPLVTRPQNMADLAIRLLCGIGGFGTLLVLHPIVIGVSAL